MLRRGQSRTQIGSVIVVMGIALADFLGDSGTAAAEDLPSCLDHTWYGDDGYIAVRTSPEGTVAWGVKDFQDNSGVWDVRVFVGKTLFDWKKAKPYNPHGSIPASRAPKGSIVHFEIEHVNSEGHVSHSVPNGCIVP